MRTKQSLLDPLPYGPDRHAKILCDLRSRIERERALVSMTFENGGPDRLPDDVFKDVYV